ncbi:bacillithiol biosynthesis deacetylase BshB1 [Planctomycetota bacterium]
MDLVGFGAHPDDVELTSGGLFLKMAAKGYKTAVVDLSRGESGTRGTPETRAKEAARAAEVMKLHDRINLGLPDGEMEPTREAKRSVAGIIRSLRPSVVVAPYWKDSHPDHVHASNIVTEGAFIAGLAALDIPGEPWRPKVILYAMYHQEHDFVPSLVVDISSQITAKHEVVKCYGSQLYNPESREQQTNISRPDFWARIEARARMFGDLIGVEFAEGFMVKHPLRIDDPVEHFATWENRF